MDRFDEMARMVLAGDPVADRSIEDDIAQALRDLWNEALELAENVAEGRPPFPEIESIRALKAKP